MKKKLGILFLLILVKVLIFAQESDIDSLNYKVFTYADGSISSEGFIVDGRPNGYWKAFYQDGNIKSEGNRENFKLEGLWKFYNVKGELSLEVNYQEGKKNGVSKIINEDEIIIEKYENDILVDKVFHYYPDGKLKKEIPIIEGKLDGMAKKYNLNKIVISVIYYKKGYIYEEISVNRLDKLGLKHGMWMEFYPEGMIRSSVKYVHGKKNGFYKEYSRKGSLKMILKYDNDKILDDVIELEKLKVVKEYYSDGSVKNEASYRDDKLEGLWRDYDKNGKVIGTKIYNSGVMIGEGILDVEGKRQGTWKLYYYSEDKQIKILMGEGNYSNGKKKGFWKYYYRNGNIEQEGKYDIIGRPVGAWKWYFESGEIKREEMYYNGKRDGSMIEYDIKGNVLSSGEFIEDLEEGAWVHSIGDVKYIGKYSLGERDGNWKHYSIVEKDGEIKEVLSFEGSYLDGSPVGKHVKYWENGRILEIGEFFGGKKTGEWRKNYEDGTAFMSIYYEKGMEVRYDNQKIKPKLD